MALLTVNNLHVGFRTRGQLLPALSGISFELSAGERIAVIGESGAGKSLLGYAITNLIQAPGQITGGEVSLHGNALSGLSEKEWQTIRGRKIAMIFQDPMVTLNPVLTIGAQLTEVIRVNHNVSRKEARTLAIEALMQVRLSAPEQRLDQYPHELSGGMRQRVVIAIALLLAPEIIIADEPTTALDVTIQADILQLLKSVCEERHVALMIITHDFGVVSRIAERTLVMYAGRIVERGETLALINDPQHPYTQGLLNALPQMALPGRKLNQIPGSMPAFDHMPSGCAFHPRCPYATEQCQRQRPAFFFNGVSTVACFAVESLAQTVEEEAYDD